MSAYLNGIEVLEAALTDMGRGMTYPPTPRFVSGALARADRAEARPSGWLPSLWAATPRLARWPLTVPAGLVLVTALVVAYAAYGGRDEAVPLEPAREAEAVETESPSTAAPTDEKTLATLEAAAAFLNQAGSAHFDIDIQLTLESLDVPLTYSGDYQAPDRSQGKVTGPVFSGSEVITVGETAYFTDDLVVKGWMEVTRRVPFFIDSVRIITAALSGTGEFELVGEESLDGVPVHHLAGTNPAGILDEKGGEVRIEVWIGRDDHQLKQIVVEGPEDLGPEGHPVFGQGAVGIVRASATMSLSDFGKLVSIESPVRPQEPGHMKRGPGRLFRATLLGDGRVLVTGGERANVGPIVVQWAEIYDPVSGTWSSAGDMSRPRGKHTATVLQDGRVLIAGGVSGDVAEWASYGSSELYDPSTGVWTPTGSMSVPRYGHVAVLLTDGRVLAAGGWVIRAGGVGSIDRSAELYDPSSGTWSSAGNLVHRRALPAATLLPDGRVLVTGGTLFGATNTAVGSAEIYDPATGEWSETASMSTGRGDIPATLLEDGRVLVAGGADGDIKPIASAEIYDPISETWSPAAGMDQPRFGHGAFVLADGRVLIAGDFVAPKDGGLVEIYDPSTDSWTSAARMLERRSAPEGVLLLDRRVLAVGRTGTGRVNLTSAEIYDPTTDTWTLTSTTASSP